MGLKRTLAYIFPLPSAVVYAHTLDFFGAYRQFEVKECWDEGLTKHVELLRKYGPFIREILRMGTTHGFKLKFDFTDSIDKTCMVEVHVEMYVGWGPREWEEPSGMLMRWCNGPFVDVFRTDETMVPEVFVNARFFCSLCGTPLRAPLASRCENCGGILPPVRS
ncbi:MAG: hypothetical protein JW839_14360 [Candidatus Lokiarchaeota archaeon]|nr:hypothetical protein [Candidatus Lokiarchaeota archaeon]